MRWNSSAGSTADRCGVGCAPTGATSPRWRLNETWLTSSAGADSTPSSTWGARPNGAGGGGGTCGDGATSVVPGCGADFVPSFVRARVAVDDGLPGQGRQPPRPLALGRTHERIIGTAERSLEQLDRLCQPIRTSSGTSPGLMSGARHRPRCQSSAAVAARACSSSTIDESASVEVSPMLRPSATSRRSRRMILPLRVFGRSGVR